MTDKEKLNELAALVEELLCGIDEEMDHGDYHAPDCIPYEHEDEEDYYGRHDEIVANVVRLRLLVKEKIAEIKNGNHLTSQE